MIRRFTQISLIYLCLTSIVNAQSSFANEIGFFLGPISFRSDYGQRENSKTNLGNTGFGFGIIHYLSFSYNSRVENYFTEHFKFRSELSYNTTKLNHFGQWVEKNPPTLGVQQLRAMYGKTTLINLGSQLEYWPVMRIHEFERSYHAFSPFLSGGAQISYYSARVNSTMGEMGSTEATFPKYLIPSDGHPYGFSSENGAVLSLTAGVGCHYKLNEMNDLFVECRFQGFRSDWIDGLNPNRYYYPENKSNDYLVSLNLGYVIYLDN